MLLKIDFAELRRGGVSLIPGFQPRQRLRPPSRWLWHRLRKPCAHGALRPLRRWLQPVKESGGGSALKKSMRCTWLEFLFGLHFQSKRLAYVKKGAIRCRRAVGGYEAILVLHNEARVVLVLSSVRLRLSSSVLCLRLSSSVPCLRLSSTLLSLAACSALPLLRRGRAVAAAFLLVTCSGPAR